MRNGYKIFDADAHVVEPRDLWERFLDREFQHRVGWQQPIPGWDQFRPAVVDGQYNQHTPRLPFSPAATSTAAIEATIPTAKVATGALMCWIVS